MHTALIIDINCDSKHSSLQLDPHQEIISTFPPTHLSTQNRDTIQEIF